MSQIDSMQRRAFLRQSGGVLGSAALAGFPGLSAAQQKTITAVMLGVIIPDPVRPIIENTSRVKVNNLPFVSQTDLLAKLTAPGGTSRYDYMVVLTDYIRGPLLGEREGQELAMPLDLSKLPNSASQTAMFKGTAIQRGGKTYGVPFFGGYDSVIYNRKKIPENDKLTQSWNLLFSDKYAGRVAVRDDAHQTITAAALALGHKNPADMNKADLDEVAKFLISKKKNFRTMWTQFGEAVNMMSSGEVDAMYGWIPMRAALQKKGVDVTNNWPTEGLLFWSQCGIIPKNAPNPNEAHAVLNAMCGAEYGTALTRESEYLVANSAAAASFSAADRRRYGYDVPERGLRLVPLGWPKIMDSWIQAWSRIKAA
jgi:spermidine/putrescine transport system substrate-binding protein